MTLSSIDALNVPRKSNAMTREEKICERIRLIAVKYASQYPNVLTTDEFDLLYALEATLEGQDMAIEDWKKMCHILCDKAGINDGQLVVMWHRMEQEKVFGPDSPEKE